MANTKKNSLVAGVDFSIQSPAICVCSGKDFDYNNCTFYSLTDQKIDNHSFLKNFDFKGHKPYKCDTERFNNIAMWAVEILKSVDFIGVEGYAMGAKGLVFNIAECTGTLKLRLWEEGKMTMIIPPTTNKKAATGKGNADKQMMYDAWVAETGIKLKEILQPNRMLGGPTTDLVDAFFLCRLAHQEHIKSR